MKNKQKGKLKFLSKKILMGLLLGTTILVPMMPRAYALPSEGTYASSNASTVVNSGSTMNIIGTNINNVINWNTFSIENGETVNFTDSNNYLNLVNGISKSTIDGALNGAGNIYLVNPNGIIFGSNAAVNVGSLIASTREITDTNITSFENGINPITNSTVDLAVGNITNLGNIKANSVVLEGNEVIIKNAANITVKAAGEITVGYEVTNQVDLDKTTSSEKNAANYKNATFSSLGYSAKDLKGDSKVVTKAFLVEDIYDLQNMKVNLSANYLLANDIDESYIFTPVGISDAPFTGSFNGAGNVINGLTIGETGQSYVGLFGYTDGVSIKNIGLNNKVSGSSSVGGLVGSAYNTTISNSYNEGDVSGSSNVGGLVGGSENYIKNASDDGDSTNSITISNSYNTGDVSGSTMVGGLFGGAYHSTINNSYNTGKISSTQEYAGGLAGGGYRTIEINNSYSIGDISGGASVGGLVGRGTYTTINNSYNLGTISGEDDNVGGLLGYGSIEISNSFNIGDVSGSSNLGGLVGYIENYSDYGYSTNSTTIISNSFNEGDVSGSSNLGGLVGYIENYSDYGDSTNSTIINNSYNTGDVSGELGEVSSNVQLNVNGLGGLVGTVSSYYNHIKSSIIISNSYNEGDIRGEFGAVSSNAQLLPNSLGGLVGSVIDFDSGNSIIKISNSYNTGDIIGVCDSNLPWNSASAGGLLGSASSYDNNSENSIIVSNSYNEGDVKAEIGVGGFVGFTGNWRFENFNYDLTINNSYNTGDVSGKVLVGGLFGGLAQSTINNSYNIGSVSGEIGVGGLVGDTYNATRISNSYYAITDDSGNEINQYNIGDVFGKTYEEMLQANTYNFLNDEGADDIDTMGGQDKTWRIYEGYTTPMLKSFMETVKVNDSEDIYNGMEQTGKVITAEGKVLTSNIDGNKGTNVGEYTIYSKQQGYDLVSSKGVVKTVYVIKSLQSLVDDANEDYNKVLTVIEHSAPLSTLLGGTKREITQNNQLEITNNSPLSGVGAATYDQKNDSIIITG